MKIYKVKNSLFIIMLIALRYTAFSQESPRVKFGVGIDQFISSNGHGSFYSPSISISHKRNTLSISPLIQKRTCNVNSIKLTYIRNLSAEANDILYGYVVDQLQINFFSSVQYCNNLPLSYRKIQNEKSIQREPAIDPNNLKFSTTEATLGFQFQVNFNTRLSLTTYAGVAAYYHLNYVALRNHERTDLSLCLGTGIRYILPQL